MSKKPRNKSMATDGKYLDDLRKEQQDGLSDMKKDNTGLKFIVEAQKKLKMRTKETKEQKKMRHGLYMRHLMISKGEKMKRKLVEMIDGLHTSELSELKQHLEHIVPNMKEVVAKNDEPVILDVFVVNNVKQRQLRLLKS